MDSLSTKDRLIQLQRQINVLLEEQSELILDELEYTNLDLTKAILIQNGLGMCKFSLKEKIEKILPCYPTRMVQMTINRLEKYPDIEYFYFIGNQLRMMKHTHTNVYYTDNSIIMDLSDQAEETMRISRRTDNNEQIQIISRKCILVDHPGSTLFKYIPDVPSDDEIMKILSKL